MPPRNPRRDMERRTIPPRTRAMDWGVNPRAMQNRTRKALVGIRTRLEKIAEPWMPVDYAMEGAMDRLMEAVNAFEAEIAETVRVLEEPLP